MKIINTRPSLLRWDGIVLKKSNIGTNSFNSLINRKQSTHAEIDAYNKLKNNFNLKKKKYIKKLKVINLLVIRVNNSGGYCESQPCIHCIQFLKVNILLKGYKLKYIYYSTKDGIIVKKKFTYLLDNTNHISKGGLKKNLNNYK